jgi:NADH:ubiquinone reductase (H+-translocating)
MPQHVVIAGGGFGGYYTAKTLERTTPKDVRITLVNDVNFLLYAPLLPGAAAGSLEARHVVVPLRQRLHRTEVRLGWVTGGDPAHNRVCVLDGRRQS